MVNHRQGKAVISLLLCLVTILFFNAYERYIIVGPELLAGAEYDVAQEQWQYFGDHSTFVQNNKEIISLSSSNPSILTHISKSVGNTGQFDLVELSVELKTINVHRGDKHWESARVVLVANDHAGVGMYYLPHTVIEKDGNSEWGHYKKVFRVDERARELVVSAQLMHATGTLWIRNLNLHPVIERQSFITLRALLTSIWVMVVLWIIFTLKIHDKWMLVSLVFMMCIIMLGALMPSGLKKHVDQVLVYQNSSASIEEEGQSDAALPFELIRINIYKAGHYLLFLFFSFNIFYRKIKDISYLEIFMYIVLFALTSEVMQLFVDGRDARVSDFLLDLCGIVSGFLLAYLIKRAKAQMILYRDG